MHFSNLLNLSVFFFLYKISLNIFLRIYYWFYCFLLNYWYHISNFMYTCLECQVAQATFVFLHFEMCHNCVNYFFWPLHFTHVYDKWWNINPLLFTLQNKANVHHFLIYTFIRNDNLQSFYNLSPTWFRIFFQAYLPLPNWFYFLFLKIYIFTFL